MAINVFEPITDPITGETFRAISIDKKAYTMEWTVQPEGYVPFEHIHLNQTETFEVKEGELKITIEGKEHIKKAGERITVPIGKTHSASNNKNAVLKCVVSYEPTLDCEKFMQCLTGLIQDGHLAEKGGVKIPMMGYCLDKMKAQSMARPTAIPGPAMNISLKVFRLMGFFAGWEKLYLKYTA